MAEKLGMKRFATERILRSALSILVVDLQQDLQQPKFGVLVLAGVEDE